MDAAGRTEYGMHLDEARSAVVAYAQRMEADGLAIATSGNVSARVGDRVAITPSGVAYDLLTPSMVAVCDLHGEHLEGALEPSSELPMHLAAYELEGVGAVVHPHSLYATVLSTLVDELPAIHYLVALLGGPVRVAAYETYGTEALAASVREALRERAAALLSNHGSVVVGESLEVAYTRARYLEWLCGVYYLASRGGSPRILDDREVARVAEKLAHYGRDVSGADDDRPAPRPGRDPGRR